MSSFMFGDVLDGSNSVLDGNTNLREFDAVRLQVNGTFEGTLEFHASDDGKNWVDKVLYDASTWGTTNFTTKNGLFFGELQRFYFRVFATNWRSGSVFVQGIYLANGKYRVREAVDGGLSRV